MIPSKIIAKLTEAEAKQILLDLVTSYAEFNILRERFTQEELEATTKLNEIWKRMGVLV